MVEGVAYYLLECKHQLLQCHLSRCVANHFSLDAFLKFVLVVAASFGSLNKIFVVLNL